MAALQEQSRLGLLQPGKAPRARDLSLPSSVEDRSRSAGLLRILLSGDEADFPELAVMFWGVCQRWDSSAKPRSPRHRAEYL
jgi:hypothetical protein